MSTTTRSTPTRALVVVMYESSDELQSFFSALPQTTADLSEVECWTVRMRASGATTGAAADLAGPRGRWALRHFAVTPGPDELGHVLKSLLVVAAESDFGLLCVVPPRVKGYDPGVLGHLIESWRDSPCDLLCAVPAGRGEGRSADWTSRLLQSATGSHEVDFRRPYRALSFACLARQQPLLASNDGRFLTELLLQAIHAGATVRQVEVATARPEATLPAWPVLRAGLGYRMHDWGMLCSLQYHRVDSSRYVDKTGVPYSSHQMAVAEIRRRRPGRVLDLGCGSGYVSAQCRKLGATVTGVDRHAPDPDAVGDYIQADLTAGELPAEPADYDLILLLDVIEHLPEPEAFLLQLRERTGLAAEAKTEPSTLLLSTPNVAFCGIRLNLLLGRFRYAERGILDISHKRLFTRRSLVDALTTCGYEIEAIRAVPVPFATVIPGRLGRLLGGLARWAARLLPGLFAFQYLVVAHPRPLVELRVVRPDND